MTQLKTVPKTLTETWPKKTYRWQTHVRKYASHWTSSGRCNLKQQWDATAPHPNGWNPEQWQHQMLGRMWSNRNSRTLLVGMHKFTAFDSFLQNQTYSYHGTQQSYILVFTQKSGKLCPHKNLNMDAYSSFIYKCQNLETSEVFF